MCTDEIAAGEESRLQGAVGIDCLNPGQVPELCHQGLTLGRVGAGIEDQAVEECPVAQRSLLAS